MKVRDLMSFLSGVNPEAEVGILHNTLLYKTKIYGWGGKDEYGYNTSISEEENIKRSKMSCEHITLELSNEIIL